MSREDVIAQVQEKFRQCHRTLNERQRRQWAAAEALSLGRGGMTIVSLALRMSPNTIKKGMLELEKRRAGLEDDDDARIRRSGGGRRVNGASPDAS